MYIMTRLHSVSLFKLNKRLFHILTTPTNYGYTPTLSNEGNVSVIALNLSTGLVTMATQSNVLQSKDKLTATDFGQRDAFTHLQLANYKMHQILPSGK